MPRGRPDFSPTAVDVVLRADWAAVQGVDKVLSAWETGPIALDGNAQVDYTVPTGKTFYLKQISSRMTGYAEADRDLNQMCTAEIYDVDEAEFLFIQGGNGGVGFVFAKPFVFTAGQQFRLQATNKSNHTCAGNIVGAGYEL